jgi:hypothetical protein
MAVSLFNALDQRRNGVWLVPLRLEFSNDPERIHETPLYENAPLPVSLPSTGEGGVEVIFILRCARTGHGGYSQNLFFVADHTTVCPLSAIWKCS